VRAQLAQAEKAVADSTIRAPFDGYVSSRPVAAGAYVATSSKIATVVKVGVLKLQLQVPEQRAAQVKLGMQVKAHVSAWPNREFTGKVTAINPSVDPNSRAFILEAQFANPATELRAGMFATAKVLLPGGENAVFVPRSAVLRDPTTDSYQVFTVENGAAHLKVVVPGESDAATTRIATGLSGSETVATGRLNQLFDGAPVDASSR
jgi:RND family efflux transporter MFP subunit